MNILIVTGSREHGYIKLIEDSLSDLEPIDLLVHGGATGADYHAGEWARRNGVHVAVIKALWKNLGNSAGPRRNKVMVDAFPGATVAAFPLPGSVGTYNCIEYAKKTGHRVIIYERSQPL